MSGWLGGLLRGVQGLGARLGTAAGVGAEAAGADAAFAGGAARAAGAAAPGADFIVNSAGQAARAGAALPGTALVPAAQMGETFAGGLGAAGRAAQAGVGAAPSRLATYLRAAGRVAAPVAAVDALFRGGAEALDEQSPLRQSIAAQRDGRDLTGVGPMRVLGHAVNATLVRPVTSMVGAPGASHFLDQVLASGGGYDVLPYQRAAAAAGAPAARAPAADRPDPVAVAARERAGISRPPPTGATYHGRDLPFPTAPRSAADGGWSDQEMLAAHNQRQAAARQGEIMNGLASLPPPQLAAFLHASPAGRPPTASDRVLAHTANMIEQQFEADMARAANDRAAQAQAQQTRLRSLLSLHTRNPGAAIIGAPDRD